MSADDRLAIQDLLARYADAVDRRDLDALDEVFTADAHLDYTATGAIAGDLATMKRFLADALAGFVRSQHMLGLPTVSVDGDRARAHTPCHNPMVLDNGDGTTSVWLIGIWYDDDLVRTDAGWRVSHRRLRRAYALTGLADTPLGPA